MSLKLFRSTGFASILDPGETRVAMHPGWVIAAVSAWIGFVANVAVWRGFSSGDAGGLAQAVTLGAFIAAGCAAILSVLGWRKTLKPAATLMLLLAALAAANIWGQALPVNGALVEGGMSGLFFPPWASLLRWQVLFLIVFLGLVPMLWVWQTHVRRLPGPQQMGINMTGVFLAGVLLVGSGFMLFGHMV
jgi:glucan phosphoethanolaminetransferase (alkaline phosphatase superfamily)